MRHMKRDTSEFESPEEENHQQETTGGPQRPRAVKLESGPKLLPQQQSEVMQVLKKEGTLYCLVPKHQSGNDKVQEL